MAVLYWCLFHKADILAYMRIDENNIKEFGVREHVHFLVLYGSQAAHTAHKESDIDIAISFKYGHTQHGVRELYGRIHQELCEILNVGDQKLDLAQLDEANILLRFEIVNGGTLLFGNEDDFACYQGFAYREFVDAKKLFSLEEYMIKEQQRILTQRYAT